MAASVTLSGSVGLGVVCVVFFSDVFFSNGILFRFVGLHVAATADAELPRCVVFSGVGAGAVFSVEVVALPNPVVLMGLGVAFFVIVVSPLELSQPGFSLRLGLGSG